jgi:hypothetical protein
MPANWTSSHQSLSESTFRLTLQNDGQDASFRDVLVALQSEEGLCDALLDAWRNVPLASFVWELPALVAATLQLPFESIVKEEGALARSSGDPAAFRQHLSTKAPSAFPNLGGDAWLVAPSLTGPADWPDSAHLSRFARGAKRPRSHEVLSLLGETALCHIGCQPRWISTSGLGVPWLHFRIDSHPKYYQYPPYRRPSFLAPAP